MGAAKIRRKRTGRPTKSGVKKIGHYIGVRFCSGGSSDPCFFPVLERRHG
jgi:hypothetical protein